jgi:hypothetical protein
MHNGRPADHTEWVRRHQTSTINHHVLDLVAGRCSLSQVVEAEDPSRGRMICL